MNHNFKLLQDATLLKGLQLEDIQAYVNEGRFRFVSYKKNTVIHFEGEPCTCLEIILSGKVTVNRIMIGNRQNFDLLSYGRLQNFLRGKKTIRKSTVNMQIY